MVARPGRRARQSRRCEAAEGSSQMSKKSAGCFDWTRTSQSKHASDKDVDAAVSRPRPRQGLPHGRGRGSRAAQVKLELDEGQFVVLLGPSGCGQVDAAQHPRRPRCADRGEVLYRDDDLTPADEAR